MERSIVMHNQSHNRIFRITLYTNTKMVLIEEIIITIKIIPNIVKGRHVPKFIKIFYVLILKSLRFILKSRLLF